MLVLSRKISQEIILDGNIKISVQKIKGNVVRIGIEAPKEVSIKRGELVSKGKDDCPEGTEAAPTEEAVVEEVIAEVSVAEEAVGYRLVPLSDIEIDPIEPQPVFDLETEFPESAQRSRLPKNRLEEAIFRNNKSA